VITTTTLVLLALGVLAAASGVWAYLRPQAPRQEAYLHFRCRRLRFRRAQSGHAGKCSSCGHGLIFPPVSEATE